MITFEKGIDIRAREASRPQVAKFAMGDGTYQFCIIGTEYGHVHTTGGDVRTWKTAGAARRWLREKHTEWENVKPEFRSSNPKLDFIGHDGAYLYSSNFYRSKAHAWAHVARNPVTGYSIVAKIERSSL